MNILLDENLDWRLERDLPDHSVSAVTRIGWSGTANGELLRRASERFDVFVTMDQGIYHQQNLAGLDLVVVALSAKTNRLADTKPLMTSLHTAIEDAASGDFVRIGAD